MVAVSDLCVVLCYCRRHVFVISGMYVVWFSWNRWESLLTLLPRYRMSNWCFLSHGDMICVLRMKCNNDEGRVMRTVEEEGKKLGGKVGCNWALMYNSVHTKVAPLWILRSVRVALIRYWIRYSYCQWNFWAVRLYIRMYLKWLITFISLHFSCYLICHK